VSESQISSKTATGDVTTASAYIKNVVLTASSDTATVVVKAGGSSGTQILKLSAVANTSANSGDLHDSYCASGIHVTLTGTSPAVSVIWE